MRTSTRLRHGTLWTSIGCHGCALNMPIGPVVASRERPSGMHGGRARGGTAREIVRRKEQPAKWPQMTHRQFPQMRESCDRRPRAEAPAILGWVHIGCLAPAASRLMAVGYGRDCVGRPWGLLAAAMANVGTRRKVVAGAMAVGLTRHGRGSGRGDREGPSAMRRVPSGTCRAEAEAGCDIT